LLQTTQQIKERSMQDILSQFLSEEAMQEIITGNVRETKDSGRTSTAVGRIEAYLESSPIVLFMKGSPDFPQCGFSARVVNALRGCRAGFAHVDVLEDPELRLTLKAYSNWPTIPQLYIEGELVGGCDIVMDMYQSGDLSRMVRQVGAVIRE
jgi:monothiol glutaredoxin